MLTAIVAAIATISYQRALVSTLGDVEFTNELRIPSLEEGTRRNGVVHYELDMRPGTTEFLADGPATETWGIDGSYLGPTLRVQRGDEIDVEVANNLPAASSLHWHGMHLPAAMDGGPHQMIAPGEAWAPTWTVDQPAATLWYHPHPHGATADHVHRGLAGMVIVEDPDAAVDVPDSYGVDDIPLIVQDRSFDGDNQFSTGQRFMSNVGLLGDELLVNGTHSPYLDVTTQRVRLRLLNASNARFFDFGFADDRPFSLIGADGGLLSQPVELDRVPLSPGERAEIVVELTPGERVVLRSFGGLGGGFFVTARANGHDDRFDVLELRAADELAASPEVPDELATIEPLDPADAAVTREFRLSGTQINGDDMDMSRIDEVVTVDTTEIWEVSNTDGQAHNFHIHDVQFQVLRRNGDPPPPELTGWKDTIALAAGDEVHLIMRFADFTDADTPYMFHCHILRHEDQGMMGQFVVAAPGESAGTIARSDHHDHD